MLETSVLSLNFFSRGPTAVRYRPEKRSSAEPVIMYITIIKDKLTYSEKFATPGNSSKTSQRKIILSGQARQNVRRNRVCVDFSCCSFLCVRRKKSKWPTCLRYQWLV